MSSPKPIKFDFPIRLGARDMRLYSTADLAGHADLWGQTHFAESHIAIQNGRPPSGMLVTLIHELVHVAFRNSALDDAFKLAASDKAHDLEESVCSVLGNELACALLNNPKLLALINKLAQEATR